MQNSIIAGDRLRQLAISRTTQHILDIKRRGSVSSYIGNTRAYIEAERRRLEVLQRLSDQGVGL